MKENKRKIIIIMIEDSEWFNDWVHGRDKGNKKVTRKEYFMETYIGSNTNNITEKKKIQDECPREIF